MTRLAVLLLVSIGCSDPVGSWQFVAGAETTVALDSTDFERLGDATTTFTLPDDENDVLGAFYRLEARFVRSGTPAESGERVFVRISPRFESFDGTTEVTTFLMPDANNDANNDDALTAGLVAQGSLTRCDAAGPCERELGLFVGWLAPPVAGASLDLDLQIIVELRGSGADEPPPAAAASATLRF